MARFELTKTIEAKKLNKRTGIPLGEPSVTVPCGGIIENLKEDRDFVKFTYLGEPYQSTRDVISTATVPMQTSKTEIPAGEAPPKEPSQTVSTTPMLQWEEVESSHRQKVIRTCIPGGWLISSRDSGLTFYPDPEHNWDGGSL